MTSTYSVAIPWSDGRTPENTAQRSMSTELSQTRFFPTDRARELHLAVRRFVHAGR